MTDGMKKKNAATAAFFFTGTLCRGTGIIFLRTL